MQPIAPPPYHLPEDVYYGDGSVWVTGRRLICDGDFRPLRNVRGASVKAVSGKAQLRSTVIRTLALSILFGLGLIGLSMDYLDEGILVLVAGAFVLVGACLALVGLGSAIGLLYNRAKQPQETVYFLVVRSWFGSSKATVSLDREYIERIAEAIQYALAQRKESTSKAVVNSNIGQSFTIPSPIIRGEILYAGETKYSLSEINSLKTTLFDGLEILQNPILIIFAVPGLVKFGEIIFGNGPSILAEMVVLGYLVMGVLRFMSIAQSSPKITYTVQITSKTGAKAIVYATNSKAEADRVRTSIADELVPQTALGTT